MPVRQEGSVLQLGQLCVGRTVVLQQPSSPWRTHKHTLPLFVLTHVSHCAVLLPAGAVHVLCSH